MAHDVFGNKRQCEIPQQDILKCQAIRRIKIILHDFNNNPSQKDRHENESTLMNQFASIFVSNCYTNTSLLNDFHHIKYVHRADDNDEAFSKIHEYFIDGIDTVCDGNQCLLIGRYYRDRSILRILRNEAQDNDEHNPHDPQYMMDLISRIHVYFIHSYHINRFTTHELRVVNEQTENLNLNDDVLEEMRMRLLTEVMKTKRNIIGLKQDNDKFKEPIVIVKDNHQTSMLDYTKMHRILHKHNITIAMQHLRSAFSAYTGSNDNDTLISDLIDAYYAPNDTSLPLSNAISITSLHNDYSHRHTIFGIILFQYFEKRDINAANLAKIATKLLTKYYPHIDPMAFVETAMNADINGGTFIQGTPEYKKSLQFAKIFKSIKGYKKKDLTNLYVKINSSWDRMKIAKQVSFHTPRGAIVMPNQKHGLEVEDEDANADDYVEEDRDADEGDTCYDHENKATEMAHEESKHDDNPRTENTIDFHALCAIMRRHKIHIETQELRAAFGSYLDGKKDALIGDTIDAYYCSNDESLPPSNAISIASLCGDCTRRRAIYEVILFHYFEKRDINNANFIKI
eukprot:734779_1